MSNFYCAAPWRGLHITPQGDVKTCCAGYSPRLGKLNNSTITEIINSNELKEIRQSIKNGVPHSYCKNCVTDEKFGTSERNWHNNTNPEFTPATADINEHIPALIDVRWNTTCNLSCNYCDSYASSKWANIKKIPVVPATRKYYTEVCDYINNYRDQIRRVALVGGEPLLLPENEDLLDVLPDNCLLSIITNLSINLENNKVFKKLKSKTNVSWHISFENLGSQFEYVRHGAKWEILEKNIQTVLALQNVGHKSAIHAVYSLYNATQLVELIDWSKRQGLDINWQGLKFYEYLDPLFHNESIRLKAINELDQVLSRSDLTWHERLFLKEARANYDTPQEKNLTKEFLQYTNKLETVYHPDQQGQFAKLWPEIYTELNT
jgi:radical SAM protein with 4Fe4S-binding SPASM domain